MTSTAPAGPSALVVGATGISGRAVSRRLVEQGWETLGLSRGGIVDPAGVVPVTGDLLDPASLRRALNGSRPELVVITAWMRQASETENIKVNGAIVRNVLEALENEQSVRHVALVTGLKHYLGPFDNYATGVMAETPFHEDEPRLSAPNFYYAQEDELFASAEKHGFTWSVHRSHTLFGFATGNAMNMVLTLSVYATICKELGRIFTFPGSATQWNGITDVTDAELLAEQVVWASTHPEGRNEAFNIANGDVFRWRWLWPQIATLFDVEWSGFEGEPRPLVEQMAGIEETWRSMAGKYSLVEPDVNRLASWWHSDGDLGRNIECLTDMNKSRKAGFLSFRSSRDSFLEHVERYRAARIIP